MLIKASSNLLELPVSEKGAPPSEFRLMASRFRAHGIDFVFDDIAAASVMEKARQWRNEYHLDFDHAGVDEKAPPGSRIAACWFNLEVRGSELWAVNARWTERASKMLADREYRYHSPVWNYDPETGRVLEFINAALTNLPATENLIPLAASRTQTVPTEQRPMKLVLAALKLPESANEAEALAAVQKQNEFAQAVASLTGQSDLKAAVGILEAHKQAAGQLEKATKELEAIKSAREAQELEALVKQGLSEGKLAKAQIDWSKTLGVAGLKAFLEVAPRVIPASRQTPAGGDVVTAGKTVNASPEVTEEDEKAARFLGADPKLLAASRARHAGKGIPRG